jgi:hypothetical protein
MISIRIQLIIPRFSLGRGDVVVLVSPLGRFGSIVADVAAAASWGPPPICREDVGIPLIARCALLWQSPLTNCGLLQLY